MVLNRSLALSVRIAAHIHEEYQVEIMPGS